MLYYPCKRNKRVCLSSMFDVVPRIQDIKVIFLFSFCFRLRQPDIKLEEFRITVSTNKLKIDIKQNKYNNNVVNSSVVAKLFVVVCKKLLANDRLI